MPDRDTQDQPALCDGCIVRDPWEHRCHVNFRTYVGYTLVGRVCQCPDPFCQEMRQPAPPRKPNA